MKLCASHIKLFITIILLIIAGRWIIDNWQQIVSVWHINPKYIVALVPLIVITLLLIGLINQIVSLNLDASLNFSQWSKLAFASTLANYIFPLRAGMALRAYYYNKKCKLSVAYFTSIMTIIHVITLLANSILGLGVLIFLWATIGNSKLIILAAFLLLTCFCIACLKYSPKNIPSFKFEKLSSFLKRMHEGWAQLHNNNQLMYTTLVLSLTITLIYSVRLLISFHALGYSVEILGCIFIGSLVAISTFVSITPAALGIREGAIMAGGLALGVDLEVSLLAGAIDRAVSILVVLILGSHSLFHLNKEMTLRPSNT